MCDACHEAEIEFQNIKREYTAINSLTASSGATANLACEHAFRGLWFHATGEQFPYNKVLPHHKTEMHLRQIGVYEYYSSDTQIFLSKMTGYAFEEARYTETQQYKDHVKANSISRGYYIVHGTERFIVETRSLINDNRVLCMIIDYNKKLK